MLSSCIKRSLQKQGWWKHRFGFWNTFVKGIWISTCCQEMEFLPPIKVLMCKHSAASEPECYILNALVTNELVFFFFFLFLSKALTKLSQFGKILSSIRKICFCCLYTFSGWCQGCSKGCELLQRLRQHLMGCILAYVKVMKKMLLTSWITEK